MATQTNLSPFKALSRLDPFDDLFRGFGMRPWRELEATPDLRIDVSEDDKAFHVMADLPGIDKRDIEVSVEGNQVSISGEVKREASEKNKGKEIFTERYYGKVYRSFTLPAELDSAKADAHYENGVLALTLPKKHDGSTRKIAVS
ncbi:Hsp20/alpha crystallin family protein [Frateuria defendens]|uniref:Hsp20/alpha crystallin family protein n=1 Tax=Frateuria defendens TaxID=2219559 RepID=UPI00066FC603|nr:Hsp20/alpha crystallin family protein [Frateuria defendens]